MNALGSRARPVNPARCPGAESRSPRPTAGKERLPCGGPGEARSVRCCGSASTTAASVVTCSSREVASRRRRTERACVSLAVAANGDPVRGNGSTPSSGTRPPRSGTSLSRPGRPRRWVSRGCDQRGLRAPAGWRSWMTWQEWYVDPFWYGDPRRPVPEEAHVDFHSPPRNAAAGSAGSGGWPPPLLFRRRSFAGSCSADADGAARSLLRTRGGRSSTSRRARSCLLGGSCNTGGLALAPQGVTLSGRVARPACSCRRRVAGVPCCKRRRWRGRRHQPGRLRRIAPPPRENGSIERQALVRGLTTGVVGRPRPSSARRGGSP